MACLEKTRNYTPLHKDIYLRYFVLRRKGTNIGP